MDANIPPESATPEYHELSMFDKLAQLDFMRTIELVLMLNLCGMMMFFLLPVPLQIKKRIILMIRHPTIKRFTSPAYRGLLVILTVLLLDSLRGLYIHNTNLITAKHTQVLGGTLPSVKHELESKLYVAQSNFYLSSFNLFLILIMSRLFSMQLKIANYEEKIGEAETKKVTQTSSTPTIPA